MCIEREGGRERGKEKEKEKREEGRKEKRKKKVNCILILSGLSVRYCSCIFLL